MFEHVLNIRDAILANEIALTFSLLIGGWLVCAFICLAILRRPSPNLRTRAETDRRRPSSVSRRAFSNSRMERFVAISPRTLVMLGVFGTFFGILIGLLDFNVEKIDESVPLLLEGLKTAFITSVVGIAAALLFQTVLAFSSPRDGKEEDMAAAIHKVLSGHTELLTELKDAISRDSEDSLLTQVKLLRTQNRDGQEKLIEEFRAFKDEMAKQNQEALMEALKKVIEDFEVTLQDTVGKAFHHLADAVNQLVEWQRKYSQHIEDMQARLDKAVESIESTQKALEAIQVHTGAIPDAIAPLRPALDTLQKTLANLNQETEKMEVLLKAFADLGDKAGKAFPRIEENLKKVTDGLAEGCDSMVAASKAILEKLRASQKELDAGFQKLLDDSRNMQEGFSTSLTEILKRLEERTSEVFAEHTRLVQSMAQETRDAMLETWNRNAKLVDDKMQALTTEFQNLLDSSRGSQEAFSSGLNTILQQLRQESERAITEHTRLIQGSAQAAQEAMQEAWQESAKRINEQFNTFDQAMQDETQRSMETLGKQLAAIAGKLAEDYETRLRELIRIVEDALGRRDETS